MKNVTSEKAKEGQSIFDATYDADADTIELEVNKAETSETENAFTYVRGSVEIKVPDDYIQLVESTMKTYKKWLKANQKIHERMETTETDEELERTKKEWTQHFKSRYAGVIAKDQGERLSPSKVSKIWDNFMKNEYRSFLQSHTNLTLERILKVGLDKFIYTLGWRKPTDAASWRENKVRIGVCCHCDDQFIPLMFQFNHGLCSNCRPKYSVKAIRKFILQQMNVSKRYEKAERDLLMDFYIMFYHDANLRNLFLEGTPYANEMENLDVDLPEWANPDGNTLRKQEEAE